MTPEQRDELADLWAYSNVSAAERMGVSEATIRRWRKSMGSATPVPKRGPEKVEAKVNHAKGEATITGGVGQLDPDGLMRQHGLDPDDWIVVSTTLNTWQGMGAVNAYGVNPVIDLHQIKVTLRLAPHKVFPAPAPRWRKLPRPIPSVTRRFPDAEYFVVEGDNQCPYNDKRLEAAALALYRDIQPTRWVNLGDGMDLPTVSRHDDHPAAMASVQECIDSFHATLECRRAVMPDTKMEILKGNHDWRLESELLQRAERMYGIARAGTVDPVVSLRNLLWLDELGITHVDSTRGWQHAEIELVGGPEGLVVRHGWLTGHNTAERTMLKRGRSVIVGHTHHREHTFWYDPSVGCERQAAVVGSMSQARGEGGAYPNFVPCDSFTQGLLVVSVYRDTCFELEHVRWDDGALRWRGGLWRP